MTEALPGPLLAALACPRCAGPFDQAEALMCSRCGVAYSFVGEIPCLVPEPTFWRARTVQRLDEYLDFTAARISDLERAQHGPDLLARTRARMARIAGGMKADRALIGKVLAPLRVGGLALPPPSAHAADPTEGTLNLLSCYENVFRDWAWGEAESRSALGIVERLVSQERADRGPARWAVFGAGAGRLAADVHQTLGPAQTLALDLNPLPLLIADRLVRGEILEASEFPVAPRSEDEVTVARQLRCPYPVRAGLTFLLADGLAPPFPPGTLDVAITPWFIDAVDADPRLTAATINRVLKPGGLWINFGPLRFTGPTSRLYVIEEILDIVLASGFELGSQLREQVPYFASPESGFRRMELVYGFAARKNADVPALPVPPTEPEWIADLSLPVPLLSEWTPIMRSAVVANGVLTMVDGRLSITDIANSLGQSWGVDPRTLDPQLQSFLARLLPR